MHAYLKLAFKLPAMIVAIALLTGSSIAVVAYFVGDRIVTDQAGQRLTSVTANTTDALQAYFKEVAEDLTIFAGRSEITTAITSFSGALKLLTTQGDPAALLQDAYVTQNPHPSGERLLLDSSDKLPAYDRRHRTLHADFRELLEKRGYYDIFLFDTEGNNVYSVFKEADFATNFKEGGGPWADTDLGRVYRAAMAGEAGQVFLSDFAPYGPSAGAPASFIASPVTDQGVLVGVLAFQMPSGRIGDVLARTLGLGRAERSSSSATMA